MDVYQKHDEKGWLMLSSSSMHSNIKVLLSIEALLLSLAFISGTLSFVLGVFLAILVILCLFPEIGFAIALTGGILVYLIFDLIGLDAHFVSLITYTSILYACMIIYRFKILGYKAIPFGNLFWISIAMAGLMFLGVFYSLDKSFGMSKLGLFFIFNISGMIAAMLLTQDIVRIERLFGFTAVIGILLAAISFVISRDRIFFQFARFRISDSIDPIILSRNLGISVLCLLYFFSKGDNGLSRWIPLCAVPFLLLPMMWSGSRAPLLGIFLCMICLLFLQSSVNWTRKLLASLSIMGGGIFLLLQSQTQISERFSTPIGQEASTGFRVLAWIQGIEDFLSSPLLGKGTGSFALTTPWIELIWPHNLIIEFACENGIVGLLLILTFLLLTLKYAVRNLRVFKTSEMPRAFQLSVTALGIFLFSLWNAMFSSNVSGNPVVWFSAGLIWALYGYHKNVKLN